MSYCRFSAGQPGVEPCDVYVFFHVEGHWQCCMCRLSADGGDFDTLTPEQMIYHLHKHREAGHAVPDSAFERLANDSELIEEISHG